MKPVLIDRSSLYKIILGLGMVMVLVFVAGMWAGAEYTGEAPASNQACPEPAQQEQPQTQPPEPAEQPAPADQPEPAASLQSTETQAPARPVASSTSTPQPVQLAMLDTPAARVQDPPRPVPGQNEPASHSDRASDTSVQADAVEYSIQVGVYADRDNALRQHDVLEARGFDVYISDYLNKNSETRYSLRMGTYASHAEAETGLLAYRRQTEGAGYIIRLKR